MGVGVGVVKGVEPVVPVPRSERTLSMLVYMLFWPMALARELAEIAGIPSKHVYPYLKPWIRRGVVEVLKGTGANIYRLSEWARDLLQKVLDSVQSFRGKMAAKRVEDRAVEIARKFVYQRWGRDLSEEEEVLVRFLARWWLEKGRDYFQSVWGEGLSNALSLAIEKTMGRKIDPETITEALTILEAAGVIYIEERSRLGPKVKLSNAILDQLRFLALNKLRTR